MDNSRWIGNRLLITVCPEEIISSPSIKVSWEYCFPLTTDIAGKVTYEFPCMWHSKWINHIKNSTYKKGPYRLNREQVNFYQLGNKYKSSTRECNRSCGLKLPIEWDNWSVNKCLTWSGFNPSVNFFKQSLTSTRCFKRL